MVRDRALAEDLAQDTFLKVFEKLHTYDPSRKFSSWLFKIAHNTAIDQLRRKSLEVASLDEPFADDPDSGPRAVEDVSAQTPEEAAAQTDLSRALTAAVGQLRPPWREVLLLRYQAGLEYADIAEATDLPLGTVKTYIHRGRKELMERLEGLGYRPSL